VLLFGAYALVDGIFNVIAFFRVLSHHWALLIEGVIGIIAGILTFAWPAITAIVLLYLIAFWAILTGIFEIIAGVRLRKVISSEWLLIVIGVPSLLFGLLIVYSPGAGGPSNHLVDWRICVRLRCLSACSGIPASGTPPAPYRANALARRVSAA
jgi:uncharacterized membrane protein HdeD (DUF308 family)